MQRRKLLQSAAALPVLGAASAEVSAASPDYLPIVREIMTSLRRRDLEAMLLHVEEDVVWHSHVGSPPTIGKAAMREHAARLIGAMQEIRWRIFDAAQSGNRLLVEGVDDFVSPEGRRVVLPYAGVFEFRGERVSAWRDYFDRAVFERLKAGEPSPDYLQALTAREALF